MAKKKSKTKSTAMNLNDCLVIGISSRALFDLEDEDNVYRTKGIEAYRKYQFKNENKPLKPGTAFPLIQAFLKLNKANLEKRLVEVIVMSRNSPDTGLRIFKSIKHHKLDITRAAFTGGKPVAPYLEPYKVDLFLSKLNKDVQNAIDNHVAAAQLYAPPTNFTPGTDTIRIAFDADAVVFSEDSELIYKQKGLKSFQNHEAKHANKPLREGPFAKFLKTLSVLQNSKQFKKPPVRLAIVTARNSPAHERVIKTLRDWKVYVDEAHFLGGLNKSEALQAFKAHIFFDDQKHHVQSASRLVPSGQVPYDSKSKLKTQKKKTKKQKSNSKH